MNNTNNNIEVVQESTQIKEEYMDIKGYEGRYQVSNMGNVKSLERLVPFKDGYKTIRERILKKCANKRGYEYVSLSKHNNVATFQVHQLMAMSFLNHNPIGYSRVVDHINNNPSDNRLENLQVISQRHNCSKDKKGGTSEYVGVDWNKKANRWRARIVYNGKRLNLGLFTKEEKAALAYKGAYIIILKTELELLKKSY